MTDTLVTGLHTEEARIALVDAVLGLFEQWHIHELNQLQLLGLAAGTKLTQGMPLPDDAEVLERAGQLLAIERALRKRYPYQPSRRDDWVMTANPLLNELAPINIMLEGLDGIKKVRAIIEVSV